MGMTIELSRGHGMVMAVAICSAFVLTWAGEGLLSSVFCHTSCMTQSQGFTRVSHYFVTTAAVRASSISSQSIMGGVRSRQPPPPHPRPPTHPYPPPCSPRRSWWDCTFCTDNPLLPAVLLYCDCMYIACAAEANM